MMRGQKGCRRTSGRSEPGVVSPPPALVAVAQRVTSRVTPGRGGPTWLVLVATQHIARPELQERGAVSERTLGQEVDSSFQWNVGLEHGEKLCDQPRVRDRDRFVISTVVRVRRSVSIVQLLYVHPEHFDRRIAAKMVHMPRSDAKVSKMSPLLLRKSVGAKGCEQLDKRVRAHGACHSGTGAAESSVSADPALAERNLIDFTISAPA
jgi:hypothetical protein